jgi:hypothetical protein
MVRPPMIHTHMGGAAKAPRAAAGAAVSWNRSNLPQYRVSSHSGTASSSSGVRYMASSANNKGGSSSPLFQTAATIPASIQQRTGGAAPLVGLGATGGCSVHGSSPCGCGPTPASIASSIAANITAAANTNVGAPVREFATRSKPNQSKDYVLGRPGDGSGSEIEDIFNKNRFWANQLKSINPYVNTITNAPLPTFTLSLS